MSNEELAAVAVGTSVGHREHASRIMLEAWVKFVLESISGITSACAKWAAALDHKIWNYPVEVEPVVEILCRKVNEACHCHRCLIRVQGDVDGALAGFHGCCDIQKGVSLLVQSGGSERPLRYRLSMDT